MATVGVVAGLLSQKSARKLLEQHGWKKTVGGKHVIKMEKPGHRPITLPKHGGVSPAFRLLGAASTEKGYFPA